MTIKLEGEYKSLKDFTTDVLENFTVITGKNGSGKSQFIQLIDKKRINELEPTVKLNYTPDIRRVQVEGFDVPGGGAIGNEVWKNFVRNYINHFNSFGVNTRRLIGVLISNAIDIKTLQKKSLQDILKEASVLDFEKLIKDSLSEITNGGRIPEAREYDARLKGTIIGRPKEYEAFKLVSEYRKKEFIELNENDFFLTTFPEHLLDSTELFGSQLNFLFYSYSKKRHINATQYFQKKEYGEENNSMPDTEFVVKFPQPWNRLNSIFESNNIGFRISGQELKDFSTEANVSFALKKVGDTSNVTFDNLSSGEKIIVSLVVKLFTSEFYNERLEFPELIVLDEPDAHLHPEMSQLLIDILHNTFVKKLGIKVIITTHSPSTVALCPEECIYQLKNGENCSLKKIEKDEALRLLTEFVPSLSIDYRNHRQVFVESPTDSFYFQSLFNKIYPGLKIRHKLYFISSAHGKGNCSQVISIVNSIRQSGNQTAYGLIDWDAIVRKEPFVTIHGENKRYSIENFLADPIYLVVLFLEMGGAQNVKSELGFDEGFNQYDLGNESNDRLQECVEWILLKFYSKFAPYKVNDSKRTAVTYDNGRCIDIPNWYLETQGHKLIDLLREAFISLRKFDDKQLFRTLTNIMAKSYPFVPTESVTAINQLAK